MIYDSDKRKDKNPLLSVTDAARRAGMTIGEVNTLIDAGKLPHTTGYKIENRYVKRSDLDEFLAALEEPSTVSSGSDFKPYSEGVQLDGTYIVAEQVGRLNPLDC